VTPTPKTPGWFLLTRQWVSLLGAALIVTAGISSLFVAPHETRGHAGNPCARRAQDIGQAGKAVLAIYSRHVFADLKV
jgi:hypothetical protein